MKKKLLFSAVTITILLFANVSFGQTLELGSLSPFETYAGVGAVTNEGISNGDAGTNTGIISGIGFDAANGYTGTVYNNNAITVQARIDLLRIYIHLDDVFVTQPSTHAPAFGNGETISPGVYSIAGAGSVAGALTLDGGGNPNAFFIIKFEGALTVGVGSTITLTNGTRAANVFWISQGAISVGSSSVIKGTLFAHPGAVTLGVNTTIEGRLLTSEGAITIAAGGVATMPVGNSTIPIKCLSDCTSAEAVNVLGSLKSFALFSTLGAVANAATSGIVGDIGTHGGAISGFGTSTQVGSVYNTNYKTAQAVLDLDNAYNKLMLLPNTELSHTPAFGSGETINAGVYYIAGAGSLAGTITLDGQNNPDAIFVFKFAGAFSVAAQSRVILSNGAKRCNVFWIGGAGVATGAVTMGTFTYMKGTVISHGGACVMGANGSLEGRMLSTGGAIGFSTGVIYNDTLCFDPPVDSNPNIALVKTASIIGNGALGDIINYTFKVENTGNTILTNVVVSDPMVGLTITGSPIASLAVGASSESITGTYTITQNDIDTGSVTNSALATAQDPNQNNITDISGTTKDNDAPTVTTLTQSPTISLVKTAIVSGSGVLADLITYTFTVENIGDTTLTNVVVTDPMTGLTIIGSPIASLEAGTSNSSVTGTYTITQADINTGSVTNSALATAQVPNGADVTDISGTTSDNDTPTIIILDFSPRIALLKTASVSGTGIIGDLITYTFVVTNTGNTTLTDVVVTDPMIGLTITGNPIPSLTVGASSSSIMGTHTITQADIDAGGVTNSALATAKDPKGTNVIDISGTTNDNDAPTITTLTFVPAIALLKTASVSGTGSIGNVITYIFTIKNTGNTTLNNIIVTDPMVGLTFSGNSTASLAPGATAITVATYSITQTDIDAGNVTNLATATGKDPNGTDVSDNSGTAYDNDTPTFTPTAPPVTVLPDFTPTLDIDGLIFLTAGSTKDFIVNLSEINGAPSNGLVILKISKPSAFYITYGVTTTTTASNVPVNNNDWIITEDSSFITMTLRAGTVIAKNTSSAIGFTIVRKPNVPSQTSQPITVTIVDGAGLDSHSYNNTYNTFVKAQ